VKGLILIQQTMVPHPKLSFSGHETFPFRYTWPTKAVRALSTYPDLFVRDDAIVILGVGKNMVGSMRHWCDTLGLIERGPVSGHMQATALGHSLLGPCGWDPYLENPGTTWLFQWHLISRREKASTWHLAFSRWHTEEFTRDKLADWIWRTGKELSGSVVTETSIQRDVDIFIRTYVPAPSKRDAPIEDSFDCPLVELGLILEIDHGIYQFTRGPRPTLPDGIFLYALLDYWLKTAPTQETLSFESILHGPGSPGAAFKLSENALAERLESLPRWSHLSYDETAGMRVVMRTTSAASLDPAGVVARYYAEGTEMALLAESEECQ